MALPRLLRAASLSLLASCSSGSSDPTMKTPQPTTSPDKPAPLGPFRTLKGGGGGALAGGAASAPVLSLHVTGATWWTGDTATTISFDNVGFVGGSVWVDGGKRLRVGLGTIDLASKTFTIEAALQPFATSTKRLAGVAWFPDGARVALLIDAPALRVDQRPPPGYERNKRELVIVSLAGTEPPARRPVTVEGTAVIAAGEDHVLVSGRSTQLFDVHAEPVPVSFTSLPEAVARASFNAGRFVLVGSDGTVALVDARSGATVATWATTGLADAVAAGNTIVAVDREATVHVGCVAGDKVSEVAKASVGSVGLFVQIVGDHVVVEADGADPIRVATLASPCQP